MSTRLCILREINSLLLISILIGCFLFLFIIFNDLLSKLCNLGNTNGFVVLFYLINL